MGVPTWMISEELLGETPHLKFEHAKWLCLEMRHPFDLLVNHHYPCYSMLKPPIFCGEIHHFQTHPVMLPWLACPLHRRWCPWWPHGSMVPRRIRSSWPLTTFSIPRNHPSIGGVKWWKGGTDEKKSRAVWKVLLMVGESSNVPVSWCWCVACLITWRNINTEQFGSVLNARCLKRNRQGAGVPPKSTRCSHPRAWPKPVTTADGLNILWPSLTHKRKCLGVCPCVYDIYIYTYVI